MGGASFRLGAPDPPPDAEEQIGRFLVWAFGEGLATVRPGGFAEAILAGGDDDGLEDDEPFIALASIIIAGLDTTVHMIGNGIAALAANVDQFEALLDDPSRSSAFDRGGDTPIRCAGAVLPAPDRRRAIDRGAVRRCEP